MKKKLLISLTSMAMALVLFNGSKAFAQEEEAAPSGIGITAGIDYWSNYLWRGIYFYGGDGVFFPYVSYDVLGSGAVLTYSHEYSEDAVGGEDGAVAKNLHAADFGLNYSYSIDKLVTIGAGLWYFHFYNDTTLSFTTGTISVTVDALPLSPKLTYNHDYYTDSKDKKDFYIQLGIGHDFELTKEAALALGCTASYYNVKSFGADLSGISDIAFSIGLSVSVGNVSYSGSFNYLIVPSEDFKDYGGTGTDDIHKFFAKFGASYSL